MQSNVFLFWFQINNLGQDYLDLDQWCPTISISQKLIGSENSQKVSHVIWMAPLLSTKSIILLLFSHAVKMHFFNVIISYHEIFCLFWWIYLIFFLAISLYLWSYYWFTKREISLMLKHYTILVLKLIQFWSNSLTRIHLKPFQVI